MSMLKRPRTEDEIKLNDSIQALISEFKSKKEMTTNDIGQFLVTFIEKSEEMRNVVYDTSFRTVVLEKKVNDLEKMAAADREDIEENSAAIKVVTRDSMENGMKLDTIETNAIKNEALLHKLEQQNVDNDIFISGLPFKPDLEAISTAITAKFGIASDMIAHKYSYEFTPPIKLTPQSSSATKKSYHHAVISFKDKATKIKFMAAKKKNGPMKYEELSDDAMTQEQRTTTIRITNRLSKFNLKVQSMLYAAKDGGKISAFMLHNGLFRIKREEKSNWEMIETEAALTSFNTERISRKT